MFHSLVVVVVVVIVVAAIDGLSSRGVNDSAVTRADSKVVSSP